MDTGGGTRFAVTAAITIVAVAVVKTLVGVPVMERYCLRLSWQRKKNTTKIETEVEYFREQAFLALHWMRQRIREITRSSGLGLISKEHLRTFVFTAKKHLSRRYFFHILISLREGRRNFEVLDRHTISVIDQINGNLDCISSIVSDVLSSSEL